MENVLVGKYFLIMDHEDGSFIGKAQILAYLHGPYYFINIFDIDNGRPSYQSVISLDNIQDLPLFSSINAMDRFFDALPKYEPLLEVSH